MRSSTRQKTFAFYLALSCAAVLVALPFHEARAQEERREARVFAQKIDEYGQIGHCDLTARLDNLAVELQNDPELRGYLVGYDPAQRPGKYAESFLKYAKGYLVISRGLDDSRIILRYGGRNSADAVKTELWVVPQDAYLPVAAEPLDDGDGAEINGKLERYSTEDLGVEIEGEMGGPTYVDISQHSFARALKKQTDSQGYIVVYTGPNALPGAWGRIARREELTLRSTYKLEAGRVTLINGGQSDETSVELWIRPKDAPPPVKEARDEKPLRETFKLYDFGNTYPVVSGDDEKLVLASLAELLGKDKRAQVNLIIHPPTPDAGEESDAEPEQAAEELSTPEPSKPEPEPSKAATVETTPEQAGAEAEAEPEEEDLQQTAERWRDRLAKEYGIEPERIVLTVGRQNSWDGKTLEVWVVPNNAPMPDAFAPEPVEDDVQVEGPEEGEAPPAGQ